MSSTERTPLTGSDRNPPNYVFMTNPSRSYRSKIHRFQCCICAGLLAIFVVAVVITVAVSVNHDTEDATTTPAEPTSPTTPTTPTTSSTSARTAQNLSLSLVDQQMDTLQSLKWPLTPGVAGGSEAEWPEPQPAALQISSALDAGQAALKAKDLQEETTPSLVADSPSNRHQAAMGTSETAYRYSRAGYIADRATKELFRGLDKASVPRGRSANLRADWLPPEVCGDFPKFVDMCAKTPFRSVDGTCNNPNHPRKWGVAFRPFRRLLPPDYADGVSAPRRAIDGGPLPSARDVSVSVHRPVYNDDAKFTVMLAVWGQFMDHDITATALNKGANMSTISCCDASDTPELMHPECFPVRLSDADPYYHQYNLTCMEFVRSAPAPVCSLGPREQLNQATAYLDASVVYGSEEALTAQLRTMRGGQLTSTTSPDGRELLPYDKTPGDGCNQQERAKKHQYCFLSGDKRANENLHLTTMHLLFVRQHNAVAKQLSQLNPDWGDERLFQEARRIVAAQIQHITYNEFLPVLMGRNLMKKLNITLQEKGYHNVYNASVDASIANGFAASAFRFAHTLLPSLFRMLGRNTNTSDYVELHRLLFDPFQLYSPNKMDDSLRGAFITNCQKIDPHFSNQVTEKLFEGHPDNETASPMVSKVPKVPGLDLVSLNIQRGRDHGLPPYAEWRRLCGLSVPKNFSDMEAYIDSDTVQRLASLYRSVDDVDMYSGAISEVPVSGGALGPTVLCVLSDQFYRTKIGDRFWYETPHRPQAFTPEQLQEIRKTTLAGIICDNSDNIHEAQPWVMRLKKTGNYPVPCNGDVIQHPDLSWWREESGDFPRDGRAEGNVGPPKDNVRESKSDVTNSDTSRTREEGGADSPSVGRNGGNVGPWKANVEAPKGDVEASKANVGPWKANVGPWKANVGPWKANVGPSKANVKASKANVEASKGDVEASKGDVEASKGDVRPSKANVEASKANVEASKANVEASKGDVEASKGEVEASKGDVRPSKANVEASKANVEASKGDVGPSKANVEASKGDVGPSKANVEASKGNVEESKGDVEASKGDVEASKANVEASKGDVEASKANVEASKGDVTHHGPTIAAKDIDVFPDPGVEELAVGTEEIGLWSAANGRIPVHAARNLSERHSARVKLRVNSGDVVAVGNDSTPVTWWDGALPLNITRKVFDDDADGQVDDDVAAMPVFGQGVLWQASLRTDSNGVHIVGNFSLPRYLHGTARTVQWWTGRFRLDVVFDGADIDAFVGDAMFSSRLYFHSKPGNSEGPRRKPVVSESVGEVKFDPPSQDVVWAAKRLPIVLTGSYQPGEAFLWNGEVLMVVP